MRRGVLSFRSDFVSVAKLLNLTMIESWVIDTYS